MTNALARAQAYNDCLTRHVLSLIETTRTRGAPNAATLTAACETMLRNAADAAEKATPDDRLIRALTERKPCPTK
jgi:hypothetical protein